MVARCPTRYVGLGALPMQAPLLATKKLEHCMQIGLTDMQIGSHVND